MGREDDRLRQCDACGEWKSGCIDTTIFGMDVTACPMCCNRAEDDDPVADRGDWQYHRDHDQ
jgi:hypothetical protein